MSPGRLAAACIAATGLHLLAFQLWPQLEPYKIKSDEGASLQIELVKQETTSKVTEMPEIPPQSAPQNSKVKKSREAPRSFSTPVAEPQAAEPVNPQPEEAAKVAYEIAAESEEVVGAMPADVQQMILTRISYPRQARRKGWQGKATFHLDVREQKLAKLDLFHSSGHDLLDRAAIRGIRAIDRLPLANGFYSLPVEFRLQ